MSVIIEKENRALFNYLDTAASIFLVINTDHTLELVNRKGCEVLGYERAEIIGKDWFKTCIPKSERKELSKLFDRILDGLVEAPDVYENWVLAKGNKRKLIQWRNAVLKDEDDNIIGLISSGIDVTQQMRLERELRDSVAKNKAILDALPDVMMVHNEQGRILEIHLPDASCTVTRKKEWIGKNVQDLLPPDIAKQLVQLFSKVVDTGKMQTFDVTAPVSDGWVDYECRFVPLTEGRVLTIARDITQIKVSQNMLHTRNRALEAAGNGIIIADAQQPDLPIIYSNNAFTRITGYKQSEILGKNCRFLQNDDRDQAEIAIVARAIEKGEACRVVLRNYRKDGSLFWNELTLTPLYDENQKLTHFIGVQNDVTEILESRKKLQNYAEILEKKVEERTEELQATVQKLVETNLSLENQIATTRIAEDKAKESQALTSAIAQNFPKGVIVVFNADYELVYVEGEELKRSHLKKSDFEGLRIDEVPIFSEVQIAKIKEDIRQTLSGKNLSFEVVYENNTYSVNSTPLFSDNKEIIWALFVYNNISQQKKIQQELKKALAGEQELNELKSRFISMASHEFRTPLSAILSSAILIGKQNEPGKETQRKKHVDRIRNAVKNLVVILNDFLSLSKLEEGKVYAIPKHFELIRFSKLLIEEMESSIKEGQRILLKTKEKELLLNQDPKLLSHILINLLSNASKYSDEDKKIVLNISRTGKNVTLKVIDEGMGIPESEQQRLFERFFRAVNATNIQGTGLGLHIVKQYTELLDGTVSFTSKLGKGSIFTVNLPLNRNHDEKNITYRRQQGRT